MQKSLAYPSVHGPFDGSNAIRTAVSGPLERQWQIKVGSSMTSGYCVGGSGRCFVCIDASDSTCIDIQTGRELWTVSGFRDDSQPWYFPPYFVAQDKRGHSRLLDEETGEVFRPQALKRRFGILTGGDGEMVSDTQVFDFDKLRMVRKVSFIGPFCLSAGGIVAGTGKNMRLQAIEIKTGKTVWSTKDESRSAKFLSAQNLLAISKRGRERARGFEFTLEMYVIGSKEKIWERQFVSCRAKATNLVPIVAIDGKLMFSTANKKGCRDTNVVCLSARTGKTLWEGETHQWVGSPIGTGSVIWAMVEEEGGQKRLEGRSLKDWDILDSVPIKNDVSRLVAAMDGALLVVEGANLVCYRGKTAIGNPKNKNEKETVRKRRKTVPKRRTPASAKDKRRR